MVLFESYIHLSNFCSRYNIKEYFINSDNSIDVEGDVNISRTRLTKIPFNFRNVSGNFNCSTNMLTSLSGSPKKVGGSFNCDHNPLTSLEGCPTEVGGNFNCNANSLSTLQNGPKKVGGTFYCRLNKLVNLIGAPSCMRFDCVSNYHLPREILNNIDDVSYIVKYQDEYSIWNSDGTLNRYRFNEMMIDIREIKEKSKFRILNR